MRKLIYQERLGPFEETTFALIFEVAKGSFCLLWDSGPEFRSDLIFNDDITAFKFLPGTMAELAAYVCEAGMEFSAQQILPCSLPGARSSFSLDAVRGDPKSRTKRITELVEALDNAPGLGCTTVECGSHFPCPPDKPLLKCVGGIKICVKPEHPSGESNSDGGSSDGETSGGSTGSGS